MFSVFMLALAVRSATSLKIIGAGLSRTGTVSLHDALVILGYKTYHMIELLRRHRLEDFKNWTHYFNGTKSVSEFADIVYQGFDAAADFPTSVAWKDLADYYPKAKIILTHRASAEKWWDSLNAVNSPMFQFVQMIHPFLRAAEVPTNLMWKRELRLKDARPLRAQDRDAAIAFYNRHFEAVKSYDPDRTLVFDVRQGWEPLCTFLGKPIPDEPFPKTNTRQDFFWLMYRMGALVIGVLAVALSGVAWAAYRIGFRPNKIKQR